MADEIHDDEKAAVPDLGPSSIKEIEEMLGDLPMSEEEFLAIAKRRWQMLATNRDLMESHLEIVAELAKETGDREAEIQVERALAIVLTLNNDPASIAAEIGQIVTPIYAGRQRRSSKVSI